MEKRCPVGAGHDGEGQAGHDDDDSTVMADLIGHLVNEVGIIFRKGWWARRGTRR